MPGVDSNRINLDRPKAILSTQVPAKRPLFMNVRYRRNLMFIRSQKTTTLYPQAPFLHHLYYPRRFHLKAHSPRHCPKPCSMGETQITHHLHRPHLAMPFLSISPLFPRQNRPSRACSMVLRPQMAALWTLEVPRFPPMHLRRGQRPTSVTTNPGLRHLLLRADRPLTPQVMEILLFL